MRKNRKIIYLVLLVLVIMGIGISYAWYTYSHTGSESKVIAGSLYLTMNEGNDTLVLTNVFPETKEEARSRNDNNSTLTFTISGKNTSTTKDINYEIKLDLGDEKSGKQRFNAKDLVFDLVEVGDNNEETYVLDAVSYDTITDKRIWVDKVLKNTTSEVERTYKLRMWLSDDVIISDTALNADYPATGVNSYKDRYATVKVIVEADMSDKEIPLVVDSSAVMVNNGETYITNTIENADSPNNEDSFRLTITSSNNNVEFVYDPTDVTITNIASEDVVAKLSPLFNSDDVKTTQIDNEIETTSSFDKTYVIQNNKKLAFNITLVTVNNRTETTDLSFTLRKNNVITQQLVKHVKVQGKSYNVVINISDNISYDGTQIDIGTPTITYPDGTTYTGEATYKYYTGGDCSGVLLLSPPTNAGTYSVKIEVPASSNSEAASVCRQFTINKANRVVNVSNTGGTYNGSPISVTASEGAVIKYYTDSSCTEGETSSAPTYGTWYAQAILAGDDNYNDSASECTEHAISEATPTVTLSSKSNMIYIGTGQSANTATVSPDAGGEITYKYYTNSSCTEGEILTSPTNAGNYYVKATVAAVSGKTTSAESSCVAHTIGVATPTISLTSKTGMTYTGNSQVANTATVTLVNSETYSGTVTYKYYTNDSCTTGETTSAPTSGTWYVKASISAFTNYNGAESACVAHTIDAVTPTVTLEAKSNMTYTGSPQAANTATVSPDGGGEITYTYYSDNACITDATTTAPTNVGNYYVKATVAAVSGKTTSAESSCVAHTIGVATPTVTLTSKSNMEYTGSGQEANTAVVSPDVGGEITYTYYTDNECTTGATTTAPTNVGSYYVKATVAAVSGKTTSAESSCVAHSIGAKTLTPSVSASNKEYDGTTTATCSSSVSLTGVIGNDDVTATASTTGAFITAAVGTDKTVTCSNITLSGTDVANYTVASSSTTTANITKKQLTPAVDSCTNKTYDGTTTVTCTLSSLSGLISGEDATVGGQTCNASDKNAGAEKTVTCTGITLDGTDKNNYELSTSSATSTVGITTKQLTGTATADDAIYNSPTLTTTCRNITISGTVSGESITSASTATGTFSSISIGTNKIVTCSVSLIPDPDTSLLNYAPPVIMTSASIKNAGVAFSSNGGTLVGINDTIIPLYTHKGVSEFYTGDLVNTLGTIPTAAKVGLLFDGWWTSSEGGSQVIDENGVIQANVTDWTDSNGNFLITSNTYLYAHYASVWAVNVSYDNTNSPLIDCTDDNANVQCALDAIAAMLGYTPPTCPGESCVYRNNTSHLSIGDSPGTLGTNYYTSYSSLGNSFIGHILNSNGTIKESYVCGINSSNNVFCLRGEVNEYSITPRPIFEDNVGKINANISGCNASSSGTSASCSDSYMVVQLSAQGYCELSSLVSSRTCTIDGTGSYCSSYFDPL